MAEDAKVDGIVLYRLQFVVVGNEQASSERAVDNMPGQRGRQKFVQKVVLARGSWLSALPARDGSCWRLRRKLKTNPWTGNVARRPAQIRARHLRKSGKSGEPDPNSLKIHPGSFIA